MTEEPTDDEIRALNKRGGELMDELLGVLRPAAGEYGATLSAFQFVLGRTTLGPAEVLDAVANLLAHNFGEGVRIMVPAPAGEADDAPSDTKH